MNALIAHGTSSWVVWVETKPTPQLRYWVCTRDEFQLAAPDSPAALTAFLNSMLTHSQTLIGAVTLVSELSI